MNLSEAIELLKITVKNNSTNGSHHMDFGLVPNEHKEVYEKALMIVKLAILKGEITQEDFAKKVHLS
jgi:hypothetical protein